MLSDKVKGSLTQLIMRDRSNELVDVTVFNWYNRRETCTDSPTKNSTLFNDSISCTGGWSSHGANSL